ncbi:MAG: class I SAM-dependent methyltransferase [Aquisalimonadaceae bacterium]
MTHNHSREPRPCPLCRSPQGEPYAQLRRRHYFLCRICDLVWLCPQQRLDAEAERAHYDTHENNPADVGYRTFLEQLATPLMQRLQPGADGLDYGSGPGPTLSVMLEEQGFSMRLFDPLFAPDSGVLARQYDFITCTETAEHFFSPSDEFARLDQLLRPGGWLGIMTGFRPPADAFAAWHYVRDPTHVCFYSVETMAWIARHYGWTLEMPGNNVALFRKPG